MYPKYHKTPIQYLTNIQESVFGGDLTETQYRALQREVKLMYLEEDYIIWVTTENRHNIRLEHWKDGKTKQDTQHRGSGVL